MRQIQVTHEELNDVTANEFGSMLTAQIRSTARFRAGMAAAERELAASDDELSALRQENLELRADLDKIRQELDNLKADLDDPEPRTSV